MTIDEIYRKEQISVRSYNVCKYNDLNSLKDLKKYYFKHKSFIKLHNCGRKSDEELIEICNKYQGEQFDNREKESDKENYLKSVISELTRVQRDVINSFILANTNSLSIRSKNAIMLHLSGNLKIKNFAKKMLLSEGFNVKNLKNIGAKCVPEIENYISIIKDFFLIKVIKSDNEKHLISLKNYFLIQRTFSISKISNEILESESIFLLTDFLLNQNALFDKTRTGIIKNAFKFYENQKELTLDDIAEKVNLTRERVRQIRKLCVDELFNKLLFIKNFEDDLFQKYNIDINSKQIEINQELVDNINVTNLTSFSREFVSYILYVYLSDKFSLIGEIEDVLQHKNFNSRDRHNWKNFYLIEKDIVKEIDFIALANDIDKRISDRTTESYSFNFKSYLSRFLTKNNIEFLHFAFPIGEKILNEEFELYLDLDENLTFERNTKKQVSEYAYEALENLGKPSKVKEIFEKVLELYPNYETDEPKIRVSMKRKDGFVPVGRKSVFGLKKWEKELEGFKGGTIRSITREYLISKEKPIHLFELTNHISKYRPKTYSKSILDNLKADDSGEFLFMPQSFVGLNILKKKYDIIKYSKLPRQLGKKIMSLFNKGADLENILSYLKYNYKLDDNESKNIINNLDYFSNKTQINTFNKDTESSFIEKQKSSERAPRFDINELIQFIVDNQRIPRSRDQNEKKLYRIYYLNKKYLESNKSLNSDQTKLKKLIGKFGRSSLSSKYSLEVLIDFIKENQRTPNSRDPNERNLYQFYYKFKTQYRKNKLSKEQTFKFIEVAKLLQNIKDENKRN